MKQGEIVIIPFPFSDLTDYKIRPALVVSNQNFNQTNNILLICISTKKTDGLCVDLCQSDLISGLLLKESYIRFQNIFSLEKRLIIKQVAKLNDDKLLQIVNLMISYVN